MNAEKTEKKEREKLVVERRAYPSNSFGWAQIIELRCDLGTALVYKFGGEWQVSLGGIRFALSPKKFGLIKDLLLEIKAVLEDPDSIYRETFKDFQELKKQPPKLAVNKKDEAITVSK
jgi:hypothetical protein